MKQTCDLCGLEIRQTAVEDEMDGRRLVFCCKGCRQVYSMIMEASGATDPAAFRETEIFQRCVDAGIIPASQQDLEQREGGQKAGAAAPETDAAEKEAPENPGGSAERCLTLDLDLHGMWCPACAWVIEESLRQQPGVFSADCRFVTDRAKVVYDPVKNAPHTIFKTIAKLGYQAAPAGEGTGGATAGAYLRLGVCAFLTMNVMMLSFALYSGFFTELSTAGTAYISWPILVMAAIVFVYGGAPIHQKAFSGVTAGAPGMEALISLGAGAAFFYSLYHFYHNSIHLYFDTASMLITLVLGGKAAEQWVKDKIQARISGVFDLLPKKVRICTDDSPGGRFVDARMLGKGDVFRVLENDVVAADGVVVSGQGRADESTLTGEARPVVKNAGDPVSSGTRLISGDLRVRATAVEEASTAGQLISVMEDALEKKTGVEDASERVLRYFVPAVVLLAVLTGAAWFAAGLDFRESLIRAVTVLVISCPCALGVAIPLARVAGISLAAQRGILIHDFTAFERIGRVNAVVFDKTGTLTAGNWKLAEVYPLGGWDADTLLGIAAGLEAGSGHRVAGAVLDAAEKQKIPPARVSDVAEEENGICGRMDRKWVRMGSETFLGREIEGADRSPGIPELTQTRYLSYVYMSVDGIAAGIFCFGDLPGQSASGLVRALKDQGMQVALVSGDSTQTAKAVGRALGIDESRGDMTPADKADFVTDLKTRGYFAAMAGDGINDAPALAAADLGIAVHSGNNIGRRASDVTLMGSDPARMMDFQALARRVTATVRQNLWFTFVYNAVAIPVAMSGLLNPLVAVAAMMASSLSVTGNTLVLISREKTADRIT
ncbi:heavy metal translocating P-type ATPase [Desulfosalsimonas propionicica]|uniref:Heavy metal translocating P-type ATPase n=1 Tax=Desulfosalsimonas propionicica TaxID=332175 RepID=A0A7W0C8D1_9BACT|nr:heavy metal translocating P-type ATPase [Desulfosalsimonas propionicica]MBA2881032.1 heavy metal translocating P-type ATPase [Desulfosalsimonas propionicica]